jgi:hypothetical protein
MKAIGIKWESAVLEDELETYKKKEQEKWIPVCTGMTGESLPCGHLTPGLMFDIFILTDQSVNINMVIVCRRSLI